MKWKDLLKKIGIKVYNKKYTKDEIIKILQDWYKKNKRVPTREDFFNDKSCPRPTTLISIMGVTWKELIKKAGLPESRPDYTKEELIKMLKAWYKKNKRTPRESDFQNDKSLPSQYCLLKKLDGKNWKEKLKNIGIEYTTKKYTKEQLKKIILDYHKKTGRPPEMREFKISNNLPGANTITSTFGCKWNEVLLQLGIKPGRVRRK